MIKKAVLSSQDLSIGFPSGAGNGSTTTVASQIDIALKKGETIGLLGPNGCGKSTLIRTLSGLQDPLAGNIYLHGENIQALSAKERSRKISTVLADKLSIGNLSVYELVAFGRSPYTGWFGSLAPVDEEVVQWAIESTGIRPFLNRDVLHLSDGERQKVMIARALAQDTPVILLDEPTAHLDLPNRVEIIRLLRRLSQDTQKGILFSTHELDLALKAADRLWLINKEGSIFTGTPEDLVLDGTFESVFAHDSFDFNRETGSFTLHQPTKMSISISGDSVAKFWTRRALQREGYEVSDLKASAYHIETIATGDGFKWKLAANGKNRSVTSVSDLVDILRQKS